MGESKKRVCYFFDSDIGNYHYGPGKSDHWLGNKSFCLNYASLSVAEINTVEGHPMKPTRIRMCHSLVMNYGLYKKMEIFRAKPATKREMSQFHTDEYVDFLHRITPDNAHQFAKEQIMWETTVLFLMGYSSTVQSRLGDQWGAARLSRDKCDIAVNWAGGLHHAKKAEASGFCYVNDIVLGILELLRYHQRVLYIDIDVHHGDGVEEAFYTTDRVMTASFHKYGEFFPGTGEVRDHGIGKGMGYAVNVPLRDGINDENYKGIFEPVIKRIIDWYQPGAVVLQCGSDSLSGDRLGSFNLSMRGHAACVQFVKSFNLPLLLLGGGGYTVKSVSRTWAYETGLAAGVQLMGSIPNNEYYEYYGPDYELNVRPSNMTDHNTPEYLEKLKEAVFEALRDQNAAPSVQIHEVPKLSHDDDEDNEMEDTESKDARRPQRLWDKSKQHENSLSDSEDEGLGGRRHRQSHKGAPENGSMSKKRRSRSPASRSNGAGPTATPAPVAANGTRGSAIDMGHSALASGNLAPTSHAYSSSTAPMDISSWASSIVPAGPVEEDIGMANHDVSSTVPLLSSAAAEIERGTSAIQSTPPRPVNGDMMAGGA
ncbi:MAG: histone deacetylase [Tremellales sp. Tagirdzhanova-0007]|nr:MAG: histone deacetylase [Tremellales sp. Tagirdzhanova-0007]